MTSRQSICLSCSIGIEGLLQQWQVQACSCCTVISCQHDEAYVSNSAEGIHHNMSCLMAVFPLLQSLIAARSTNHNRVKSSISAILVQQKQNMNSVKCCCTGRTLHELTFTDAPELKDCYLHSLAAAPSFTLFRCVLLAASPQVMVMLSSLNCIQLQCKLTYPSWKSATDRQS